jgi:pimeloyl-ACP methyl ester carboxylesterase
MSYLDNFHYQLLGPEDGPRLVFLHGLFGAAANWRTTMNAFKDRYQILAYDQRGHGRSFQPESGYAPEDYASDLAEILEELKWSEIHLVGHSMGARNALQFAADHPRWVSQLVIEDIGPNADQAAADRLKGLLEQVPVPFADKRSARDYLMNDFVESLGGGPQAKTTAQFFYTNIEERADGQADWRFYKAGMLESLQKARERDRWAEWKSLAMPVLVIRGERSQELDRETFAQMLERNSRAEGREVEGAGHWVHFEAPKEFIAVLEEFLPA